jgi:hypothetical protein
MVLGSDLCGEDAISVIVSWICCKVKFVMRCNFVSAWARSVKRSSLLFMKLIHSLNRSCSFWFNSTWKRYS